MNKIKASAAITGTLIFAAVSFMVAGCGNKATDTAVAPPTSLKGQAPATPTGEVKGSAEQEAAKAKGMQQGPAVQAALEAQQTGQPAPK